MCTAATYQTKGFYFGRNLDYEFSYGESIAITPRNYVLHFRHEPVISSHYAMIGMAHVAGDYPLYYDAMNEKGVCMAGLNFVGNAHYFPLQDTKKNIASFEFIPWILAQCASVREVRQKLSEMVLVDTAFSEGLPPSSLHWMIADQEECIVVENTEDGMHIYTNPTGVLTNNPPFPLQLFHLNNYASLSEKDPVNTFSKEIPLSTYSRGMGGIGLPGDLSSMSRFVKVAFTRAHSLSDDSEQASVSQFFHILTSVEQQRGCCEVKEGKYEITIYSSCCSADRGIYYYTTYNRRAITAVDMHKENLDSSTLISYPMLDEEAVISQN